MYELTNCELQEVSGGVFTNIFGIVAGYNQFSSFNTIGLGIAVGCIEASLEMQAIMTLTRNENVALLSFALAPVTKSFAFLAGYYAGVGIEHTFGKAES